MLLITSYSADDANPLPSPYVLLAPLAPLLGTALNSAHRESRPVWDPEGPENGKSIAKVKEFVSGRILLHSA